jgi:hypothetical protein
VRREGAIWNIELGKVLAQRLIPELEDAAEPKLSHDRIRTLGFDWPLYVPPFDRRRSFQDKMFGWDGALSL